MWFDELPTLDQIGPSKAKILLLGDQGSGKTRTASTIAEVGRTFWIDMRGEYGTDSVPQKLRKNITISHPQRMQGVVDLLRNLEKGGHGFKAVVIEGLSPYMRMVMRKVGNLPEEDIRAEDDRAGEFTHPMWNDVKQHMDDFNLFFYALANAERGEDAMHVVMTSQTRVRKWKEDEEGEAESMKILPHVIPSCMELALSSPSMILHCELESYFEEGEEKFRHVVRAGPSDHVITKIRKDSTDKKQDIPDILGRTNPLSLPTLLKKLGIPL